jgi:hypothetical protein
MEVNRLAGDLMLVEARPVEDNCLNPRPMQAKNLRVPDAFCGQATAHAGR